MLDDELLRDLRARHAGASISSVDVDNGVVAIRTARPGVLIGKRGATVEALAAYLRALPRFAGVEVRVNIVEVRRAEIDALLVAAHVVQNLNRGVAVERTVERATKMAMHAGARACRVVITGAIDASSTEGYALLFHAGPSPPPPGAHAVDVEGIRVAVVEGVRRVVDDTATRDLPDDYDGDIPDPTYVDVGAIVCTVAIALAPA